MFRRQVLAILVFGALAASITGCSSDATSPTSPTDYSPPATPGNLHSTQDPATGSDWLDWDPSTSDNVAIYEIHIADSPGGAGSQMAIVDASTSAFLLPVSVSGGTEYYRVRAISESDVPSAFTPTVSVNREPWQSEPTGPAKPGRGSEGDN